MKWEKAGMEEYGWGGMRWRRERRGAAAGCKANLSQSAAAFERHATRTSGRPDRRSSPASRGAQRLGLDRLAEPLGLRGPVRQPAIDEERRRAAHARLAGLAHVGRNLVSNVPAVETRAELVEFESDLVP